MNNKRKLTNKAPKILFILLLLASISAAITFGLLYYRSQESSADQDVEAVKEAVSQHYKLPEDQDAAVATIINVEDLKAENPEFYKNAKNGMKLLVYTDKAILYDPEEDLIINVAPVLRQAADNDSQDSVNPESVIE